MRILGLVKKLVRLFADNILTAHRLRNWRRGLHLLIAKSDAVQALAAIGVYLLHRTAPDDRKHGVTWV